MAGSGLLSAYPWERPLGARPLEDGRTEFRVWAPHAPDAPRLLLDPGRPGNWSRRSLSGALPLEHAGYGIYEVAAEAPPGTDYCYLIGRRRLPDPASRWQPFGLRGPSRVYAPSAPGPFTPRPLAEQVIYELFDARRRDRTIGAVLSGHQRASRPSALGVGHDAVLPGPA